MNYLTSDIAELSNQVAVKGIKDIGDVVLYLDPNALGGRLNIGEHIAKMKELCASAEFSF